MRAELITWLMRVHGSAAGLVETLFLSVNYLDRFLSRRAGVHPDKLQLVGATAMLLAAKYVEGNATCLTVKTMAAMCGGAYSANEIVLAERIMMTALQHKLGWPGPMDFLHRTSKADGHDLRIRTLAQYFLEVAVMDERFIGCVPSFTAAGAYCLARIMLRRGDWVGRSSTCFSLGYFLR